MPQDNMTTSAARELRQALKDERITSAKALALITAALKRCRNEALEEASHKVHSALVSLTMTNRYLNTREVAPAEICYAATNAIENLKEAE